MSFPQQTPDHALASADGLRTQRLREFVRRVYPGICRQCQHLLIIRDVLVSNFYGMSDAPHCIYCVAANLSRPPQEFLNQMTQVLLDRECYRTIWAEHETLPFADVSATGTEPSPTPPPDWQPPSYQAHWDAGELGCGDLVLALRARLLTLEPGHCLRVTARDPAAPEDLPAWCRLTGHFLLAQQHPDYYILRKKG